jgi:signal peptide peptidase SppA
MAASSTYLKRMDSNGFFNNLIPLRFRKSVPVVNHVTLSGAIGIGTPMRPALTLKSVNPVLERAFKRKGLSAVAISINSPGGSPVQSDLIARRIRQGAARHNVKVHAVIGEVGASGGYWLACAADRILANPMSIVGSIGVVSGGFGFDQALARLGIARRLRIAGANKARNDPFSPERPQDAEFTQALLDDLHERFKAWVRDRRGAKLKGDEAALFDGGYMLGARALELGLIDGLGDTATLIRDLGGERARAHPFAPRRRGLLSRLPRMLAEAEAELHAPRLRL